mgnify:FL=1
MYRRFFLIMLSAVFLLTAVGTVSAMEEGNKRKGKYTYRKVYKACFERGAVDSQTPPLSPNTKTMAEWEALYNSKDYADFGCEDEWGQLSDTEVLDIFTYLYAHGSDSPTPASCK